MTKMTLIALVASNANFQWYVLWNHCVHIYIEAVGIQRWELKSSKMRRDTRRELGPAEFKTTGTDQNE